MNRIPVSALLLTIVLNCSNTLAQGVYLKEVKHSGAACLVLGNEKTGIVIPKNPQAGDPPNWLLLAPIQAMRFPDGSVSDNELNFLEAASDVRECSVYPFLTDGYKGRENPVKKRTLTVVKQTATEITVNIKYSFAKAENKGTLDNRGDAGYFSFTATLKSGEPVVMIEEETDYNLGYKFETGRNLFNQARYRGHASNSVESGYMIANGAKVKYDNGVDFPGNEALVDLNYDVLYPSCAPYRNYESIAFWDVWAGNTGWYWQFYNRDGGPQSPCLAIMPGKASRLVGVNCVQVNLFTRKDTRAAGVRVNILRRTPAQFYSKFVRYQWGLYWGNKSADVVPQGQSSAVLKWFNRKAGIAEKLDQYEKTAPPLPPEFEWAAFYQDKSAVQQIIQRSKKEVSVKRMLASQDEGFATVFDAWGGDACSAEKTYNSLKVHYESFKETMINGQGIYGNTYVKKGNTGCNEKDIYTDFSSYIRAADWFRRDVLQGAALMAADKAGIFSLRRTQKDSLKLFAGVYARVLWDDDFAPMTYLRKEKTDLVSLDHGVNYGGENMYVAYRAGRDFFALLYRNDPFFKPLSEGIAQRCRQTINEIITPEGASTASPHYTQPTMEAIVLLLLQLKQQGVNFFEKEPKLKAFAKFYLNLLTPPSVRFAGNRKLTSFGDGSEESAALFGLLSTGFRSTNAELNKLSEDLDEAYRNGPMRILPKSGIMPLVYDYSRTGSSPISSLSSASYPGYLSHFRSKPNTPAETAIWMLNGNHYNDHRNDDDGELSIYALHAPLSLSRSSLYEPHANAATIRSMVVPLKNFPNWSGNAQPVGYENNQHKRTWLQSGLNRFADFNHNGFSSITMGRDENKWKRDLLFYHGNEHYPIIIIKDELTSREPQIWSMPFFSEGPIQLPDRTSVTTSTDNCIVKQTLPNAASINGRTEWNLLNGWNQFSFTGQEWRNYDPAKNVNGIDWWLFTYNQDNSMKASFTEWTNFYIPTTEQIEFEKTHPYKFSKTCLDKAPNIRYRETQQVARFKGSGRFMNIIMPFRKGEAPGNVSVKQTGAGQFTITRTVNGIAEAIDVSNDAIVYQSAKKTVITTFGATAVTGASTGISVSGGVGELVWEGNKVTITVPLNSGNRAITLPSGAWKTTSPPANVSVALSGNKLTVLTGKDNGRISSVGSDMVTVTLTR